MVDDTPYQLEWVEPHIPEAFAIAGDQCLPAGMGSYMPGSQNGRPLVERGAESPHKLPRTPGSLPGSEVLRQRKEQHHDITENGQYHSNSLHKQVGRDGIPMTEPADKGAMAVVYGEGHNSQGIAPSRCDKHYSRCGVTQHARQSRLEALSSDIQEDRLGNGTTGSGLVCLKTYINLPGTSPL